MQRMAGYILTGSVEEHCLFLLHGVGRNGKSVFLNTLSAIVGEYGKTIPSSLFTVSARDSHPTGLADLDGVRLVVSSEIERGQRWAESLVKTATGGDRIRCRQLYQNSYEFKPKFKLLMAANDKPEVQETDEGIWSRMRLIPFNEVIPEGERDTKLLERLREEAEGILAWMVLRCLAWQAEGLAMPDSVRTATMEYRQETDFLGEFLQTCCVQEEGAKCSTEELHRTYDEWRKLDCDPNLSKTTFAKRLTSREIQAGKIHEGKTCLSFRKGYRVRGDWRSTPRPEAVAA